MLAIPLAGGVAPQTAAWTADALGLYVNAYCLEHSLRTKDDPGLMDHDELLGRFAAHGGSRAGKW